MPRYIDADKLIVHLKDEIKACEPKFDGRANGKSVAYGTELGLKSAISFAETLATADVAPRAEVAREIFEEIDRIIFGTIIPNDCAIISIAKFSELKKKYTDAPDTNVGHKQQCTDCKHFVGCECFSGMTCDQYEEQNDEM